MPKDEPVTIPRTTYDGMVETMIQLANRDAAAEDLILRVARAAGITEVEKHIIRMRKYVKSHTRETRPAATKPTKQSRKRRAAPPPTSPPGEHGATA